jgi:transposase
VIPHPIVAPGPYFILRSRKMEGEKKGETRYVGIDLGKRTYEMAVVGKGGKVAMSNGKTYVSGRQALYKKLRAGDKVALEAGNLAFIMAKEIEAAVGCRVYVLNPWQLAVIYASMKKTDKEDSLKLAHMLEDCNESRLPEVPVPSDKEYHRRKLLSCYQRAQQDRNRMINRMHALFVSQGITTKARSDLCTAASRAESVKELSGTEFEEAEYLVESLMLCERRIKALEKQMADEVAGDEDAGRLQSIPGVGLKVAFAFLAHVAAERFDNAGQVRNYLGLVPRVYISGQTVRYGRITKRGNGYVRALLLQAAWALIRSKNGGRLKARYKYMTEEKSISKKKSAVAIARRIAELMYTILRDGTIYEPRTFTPPGKQAEALAQLAISA